ncbi:MAG: DNA polymerase III subunit gamma/tau [Candidatus Omnitrophica bacterium]|nr:DNA polymerase III subunit gamma/tau [Candidatus Omnitrophota bacterium]
MAYIVFARKYRPKNFDEITGQSHITTTLKNAIDQSRVAHAYLFAGPRGVGKTTTARILAKALNCEKGPTSKPCDKCASCREITSGSSLDILEIDGASNRGIDEMRSLRENAKFAPSKGAFKIYIIDEVHMLSNEAFNALLKTLEEPPPHVKFIFATTHAHKVPPTILSRCQRFDFRRISPGEILDNLRNIAKEEKLTVDDEALSLIAKYGDGSMRDAQVILDQISSFTRGSVRADDVTKILGIVDDEVLFGLSGAICSKDPKEALKIIDELVNNGKDVMQAVTGMIEHFRNISITKVTKEPGRLIDALSDKVERYRLESAKFTIEQILYIIYTLSNTIDFMRKTDMAKVPFEAAMIKLTLDTGVVPISDIIKRMEALEDTAPAPVVKKAPASGLSEPKVEDQGSSRRSCNIDEILSSWTKVISYIKAKKISIASYLQEGDPVTLEDDLLTIGFAREFQFHKEVLETADNRRTIEGAIRDMLGLELRVVLVVTGSVTAKDRSGSPDAQNPDRMDEGSGATDETAIADADPIVKKALEMFGGKLSGAGSGGPPGQQPTTSSRAGGQA